MIDQVGEGNRLTIGEGVETTLAALQLGLLQLGLNYNRDQPELRSLARPGGNVTGSTFLGPELERDRRTASSAR